MERRRHQRTLLTAIVIALIVGTAWGQRSSTGLDARDEAVLYLEFVRRLAVENDLGGRILSAARTGAGLDEEGVEVPNVCATLAGTGGNPRMDGGGGNPRMDGGGTALAPFPSPGPKWPYANVANHAVAFGEIGVVNAPGRPVAVIDVFRFDEDVLAAFDGETAMDVHALWRSLTAGFLQQAHQGSVPHGHLVLFHLLASWAGEGSLVVGVDHGTYGPRLTVSADAWPAGVTVFLLEIEYDAIATIAAAMNAARSLADELGHGAAGHAGLLVVTSWGLVDCTLEAGYREGADQVTAEEPGPATFADYVAASLAESSEGKDLLVELCQAFDDEIAAAVGKDSVECGNEDFLTTIGNLLTVAALAEMDARARRTIDWPADVGTTVLLASAGNQALPFPMPPAAWPGVIGVEACVAGDLQGRAAFSNVGTTGEVGRASARALGAWFLTPEVAADGVTPLGYWGTSFSAPAAAAALAGFSWNPMELEVFEPCIPPQRP